MTRLITDLDNYYLLGFSPPGPKDSKYHQIEVRVNRPGVTVRHRRGYLFGGPPAPPKNSNPLGALIAPVMPKTDLALRLGAVAFFTTGTDAQVLATLEVDLPPGAGGRPIADVIEYGIFAADLHKKKVTRSESRRVDVTGARVQLQAVLTLPPGAYQLRASAMSKARDKSGGVALGTLRSGPDQPGLAHVAPVRGLALPFVPSLDRLFTPADTLRIFFQLRRANAATAVTGTITLVDDAGHEALRTPWALAPLAAATVDVTTPLMGVAPGPYRLVVTASDGQHSAVQEVAIRVVSR